MLHFHVKGEQEGGYWPDTVGGFYATRADADAGAADEAARCNADAGEDEQMFEFAAPGLWIEAYRDDVETWQQLRNFIEVVECHEADCVADAARDAGVPVLDFLRDNGFTDADIDDYDFEIADLDGRV